MTQWTAAGIPDQSGRRIVVTGANSGLGAVTADQLAAHGATVVLACRDTDKGHAAAKNMTGDVTVRRLDLADLASVRAFADDTGEIEVLINNAGIMAVPKGRTADGFEVQFGTNHLGHFALTGLLLPRITDRVVTMSSSAHQIGRINLGDPNYQQRRYRPWGAYGQSKLANLMFAFELQRRLTAAGSPLRSMAAHPGYAATELQSHSHSAASRFMALANSVMAQSAEQGALPELYAATAPSLTGGEYVGPDGLFQQRGYPKLVKSTKRSHDLAVAAELWTLSERLTGISYL